MSLVGNLEDLSLADLIQIISLSLKSGLLVLKSDEGSGEIVFCEGLVFGACLMDVEAQGDDRSGLRVDQGSLDPASSDTELDSRRSNALLQASVESAVIEMFSWSSGDFSFDALRETESKAARPMLETGINAQYLAMEGMRSLDEQAKAVEGGQPDELFEGDPVDSIDARQKDPVAGGSSDLEPAEPQTAADAIVASVLEGEAGPPADEKVAEVEAELAASGSDHAAMSVVSRGATHSDTLILMDPDVVVLEWVKNALSASFNRVHVFQRTEQGLARIRQYLIRGELPVVLISLEAKVDSLSGIRGLADFVKRLRAQAAHIKVLGLVEEGCEPRPVMSSSFDDLLVRPARSNLLEGAASQDDPSAQALSGMLDRLLADCRPDSSSGG